MSPQEAVRRGSTAQAAAYRFVKRHIAGLPPEGRSFLTESEIARSAGTSRTPVREAFLRLEAEGFLQIVPGKGAFVPSISDTEVHAVMEARELVEHWCVRNAATAATEFVGELDRLVADQQKLLHDPIGFIERDRAFHRAIVGQAGNPVLADFYESLRDRQVRMGLRAVSNSEDRSRTVLAEHAGIVDALRSRDPDRASAALAAHLASTMRAMRLQRVASTPSRLFLTDLTE